MVELSYNGIMYVEVSCLQNAAYEVWILLYLDINS